MVESGPPLCMAGFLAAACQNFQAITNLTQAWQFHVYQGYCGSIVYSNCRKPCAAANPLLPIRDLCRSVTCVASREGAPSYPILHATLHRYAKPASC